jgi:hypothetical protein
MKYRWLHKGWRYFWNTISVFLLVIILACSVTYGIVQLPFTKEYIVGIIEDSFNEHRVAQLKIEKLTGHIPFSFSMYDLNIYSDSTNSERIIQIDSMQTSMDIASWLSGQLLFSSLEINSPEITIDLNENYLGAFRTKEDDKYAESSSKNGAPSNLEYLFPRIIIHQGQITLNNLNLRDSLFLDTETLTISDLSMNAFFEFGATERFMDIEELSFGVPEANIDRIDLFGQIFNDERYLELNAFNISTVNNSLGFSAEFEGINVLKKNFLDQLRKSTFDVSIDEFVTYPNNLRKLVVGFPDIPQQVSAKIKAKGTTDSVTVNELRLFVGNSKLLANGGFRPSNELKTEFLNFNIQRLNLDVSDVNTWLPSLNDSQIQVINEVDFSGEIKGDIKNLFTTVNVESTIGSSSINASIDRRDSLFISAMGTIKELDIGNLIESNLESSKLSGEIHLETNSINLGSAKGFMHAFLTEGSLNALNFDTLKLDVNWNKGFFNPSLFLNSNNANLTTYGNIIISDSLKELNLSGKANQINLKALTNIDQLSNSLIDIDYDLNLKGTGSNNAFGLLTIDLPNTIVDGDTLKAHQIYADYNATKEFGKSFRLTSTPLDLSIEGDFEPLNILEQTNQWAQNIYHKINQEVLFKSENSSDTLDFESTNTSVQIDFDVKDLPLFRAYLPIIPEFETQLTGSSNLNYNSTSILFNAALFDSSLSFNSYNADSLNIQITGSFRKNEPLKSFSSLQIISNTSNFGTDLLDAGYAEVSFELNDDRASIENYIESIAGNNDFFINGDIQIADTSLNVTIDSMLIGNQNYQWQNTGSPALTYYANERLEFQNFEFQNEEESLNFDGIFSDQPSDSVKYNIRNVDLARISELLNGQINFSGILNAAFTTKALTSIPNIQGELDIETFSIDERVVGDVEIISLFNSDLNRFDTKIDLSTDSVKYPNYFVRNERRGQNFTFEGYVLSPDNVKFSSGDSLFYFDLDFESIDLWVLPFIAPRVFTEMSGVASGFGSVWGNREDFDFSINYDIGMDDAIFLKPRFLDTHYFGSGNITLDRQNGLTFNDVFIIDPSGGSAILSGKYDLGDLGKIHEMDLTLKMDEFQFLNNKFDPDVPFFGDTYGSSVLRMTGTNLNPILTTETPILISDFSEIGLPLLEETEFNEDDKFIRFVDSFDFKQSLSNISVTNINETANEKVNPFDRTFVERFTLDLQFIALNPMKVQLIFDPVTGDQIEVDGIGRLGIRLEDEQLSMFGQFDIKGGTYQFVSGEIFTRKFDIEPGGTISWEGEPGNALLDLNAIYAARPDINSLSQIRADIDSETSQRVPVELVLNVGGSISAIENNFFFRLPNNFETRQNTTLSTQIASLNRNEDEKLIQAASFLLMGDFIPTASGTAEATSTLSNNFSGSSAVLNPLLSNQIISPLLSNQINSILRSDIGSLDIDFNLNTYNDVDLGVALRLYNDRIILSREGQITGSDSNIGDIGATYRINNTLSITAFHRQDPTFSSITGGEESQQSQDINGIGFEAEVSFDSWRDFFQRLTKPFRTLFSRKPENTEIATSE